jgi:hypothetical protein
MLYAISFKQYKSKNGYEWHYIQPGASLNSLDRCYDFKIFSTRNLKKNSFTQKSARSCKNIEHFLS